MGIMLETSSDRLSAKGGPHFGSPDKLPAVRLRTIEDAGRLVDPVHDRDPRRHRRDAPRARGVAAGDPRPAPALPPHARGDRPELPGEAGHRDASARPSPPTTAFLAAVAVARLVLGPHMSVQAPAEPLGRGATARACSTPASTIGAVSRRSRPTTSTPSAPGRRSRRSPRRPPREANTCANASRSTRATPSSRIRGLRARCGRRSPRSSAPTGLAVEGQRPEPIAWQDPGPPRSRGPSRSRSPRRTAPACAPTPTAVYGDFAADNAVTAPGPPQPLAPDRLDAEIRDALRGRGRAPPAERRPGPGAVPAEGRGARGPLPRRRRSALRRGRATRSPTSSTGTSTSPTSATRAAASAPSRSGRSTPSPTRCPWTRSRTAREEAWIVRRDGGLHPGRAASEPARQLLLPHPARPSRRGCRACTSTRSARWRS